MAFYRQKGMEIVENRMKKSIIPLPAARRDQSNEIAATSGFHGTEIAKRYIETSLQPSSLLKDPDEHKKLLILDLNGTLVSRTHKKTGMFVRPYQDEFLHYIFRYFTVMVWSSAMPKSVDNMCQLFGDYRKQLALIWDRTHFGFTHEDYVRNVSTVKDMDIVWRGFQGGCYDATNTILLDDSRKKARLQPYNAIHVYEFEHYSESFRMHGERELLHAMRYLEDVRRQSNVCSYMRQHPYQCSDPSDDPRHENEKKVYHYEFSTRKKDLWDFSKL